jgi:ribosomal protein L7/L12
MPNYYFKSYTDYFWKWEDQTETVAIPGGKTIAIKPLISEILDELSDQGLPPFGSLLLTILALNPNGKELIEDVLSKINANTVIQVNDTTTDAFEFLKLLASVPLPYKTGAKKKLLFKTLFEDCHNILSAKKSKFMVESYLGTQIPDYCMSSYSLEDSIFQNEFKVIALLKRKFQDVNTLIEKIANLPDFKEELILEKDIEFEPKDFIDQLMVEPKTHKIGSLVKLIWSGLNLPFHSTNSSQQATGGVSDLTNKGNLDQLLISEFANDDLIFLSRLANNEALYLSREAPPTINDTKRIILIDISLKNWGTPKTIAFATMLAIAKHPKTDIECEVFVVGDSFIPIDFNSVDSLVEAVQHISPSLDCSAGLKDYFNTYPSAKNREVFILTERSTLQHPKLSALLNEKRDLINYLILNDNQGSIDTYKYLKKSKRHIQHLEIPFERLWKQKKNSKSTPKKNRPNENYYPILVNPSQSHNGVKSTENGEIFQLTKENSLLHFHNKLARPNEIGWEIIHENIPTYCDSFEIGVLKNGEYILLIFTKSNKEITLINLKTKEEKRILFTQYKSTSGPNFVFHNQSFYHSNNVGIWSIDINGKVLRDKYVDLEIIKARKIKIQETARKQGSTHGIFKNLKTVGININENLLFNVHEFHLNQGNHIKLDRTKNENNSIEAKQINDNKFEFEDGSTVEINRSGIILLKSSNQNIPVIYIPSVLNRRLGIATKEEFTGHTYFYNEPLFELTIDSFKEKIKAITTVKEITMIGLKDASELLNNIPCNLLQFFNETDVIKAQKELRKSGVKTTVTQTASDFEPIKKIEENIFFSKYIDQFIKTIQNHVY